MERPNTGFGMMTVHPNGGGRKSFNAKVADTAYIGKNAIVWGNATVSDNAVIDGYAIVGGNAVNNGRRLNAVFRSRVDRNGVERDIVVVFFARSLICVISRTIHRDSRSICRICADGSTVPIQSIVGDDIITIGSCLENIVFAA